MLQASATLWNDVRDDRLTEADSAAVFSGEMKTHLFKSYFSSQSHSFWIFFMHICIIMFTNRLFHTCV